MFTLITSWYHEPHRARRTELQYCLNRNLEHPMIGQVWLLMDDETPPPSHPKVKVLRLGHRPRFNDMISLANQQHGPVILANTDIYFDESLQLAQHLKPQQCYALTRWDADWQHKLRFYNKDCSQDAWILQPPVVARGGDYCAGKPGCDNKLAWELTQAGLKVSNPSRTIRACHLHLTNLRRYTSKDTVPGPYLTLQPTFL